MRIRPALSRFLLVFFFSISLFLLTPLDLKAQATPAASRKGELSVFGAYARVWPDYGPYSTRSGL